MKIFLRILIGAAVGGLVGGIIGIWGVLAVAGLLYPNLEQGALIVFYTGPFGALVGLLLGIAVAAMFKRKQVRRG